MIISKEDSEKIRKFEDISKRGYYCSGEEVTNLHNKILGTRLNSTNCSSCIKVRISALVEALNKYERQQEELAEASGFTTVEDYKQEVEAIEEELNIKPKTKKTKK